MEFATLIAPQAAYGLVHVIIDTPFGSCQKYKFDDNAGLFKLSRILPRGMRFPCDFGFIPETLGEDGDALDVAVLNDAASFTGCLMTVRLLGLIRATQTEKHHRIRNDRLIAVPVTPVNRPLQRDIRDVQEERLIALEQFFVSYNTAQGRPFRLRGRQGAAAARRALERGIKRQAQSAQPHRS
jgi:inorganic pyrophosphatase